MPDFSSTFFFCLSFYEVLLLSPTLDIETNLNLHENIKLSNEVVYYSDGPVGSRKTSSMYRFVAACPDARFTIGTSTNSMTEDIAAGFDALGVSCMPIHRNNKSGQGTAVRYREALKSGTRLVSVNYEVALKLQLDKLDRQLLADPNLFPGDDYSKIDLIVDEIMTVYKRFTLTGMMLSRTWVDTNFKIINTKNPAYYELQPNDAGMIQWRTGCLEEQQPLSKQQSAILDHAINPRFRVAIAVTEYEDLMKRKRLSLSFYVTVCPSVLRQYRTATIIGANFKKSMLYKMWKDEVNFQPHPYIAAKYHDFSHKHEAKVKFNHYYFCEPTFSKSRLEIIGNANANEKAALAVHKILFEKPEETPYIFAVNNAKEGEPKHPWITETGNGFAERISPNPRGMNAFKDRHASVYFAAVNFSNIDTAYLYAAHNITPSEAREAMTYENISQFHGRTAVREYDDTGDLYFFSPDRDSAYAMQAEFGGEEPIFIDLGFEEFRLEEKEKEKADYNANRNTKREDERWSNEDTKQYDGFTVGLWEKRGDSFPTFHENLAWHDILNVIHEQSKQKRSKMALPMIREGFFRDHNNHLRSGNIESTKMLQMDVDGSDVSPEDFSRFLADDLGLTHVIYNSISSTEACPRFHFLIPLDKPVNRSVNKRLFLTVAERIKQQYKDIRFDLEVGRDSINTAIYLACLPKKAGGEILIASEVAFLDVDAWLARRQITTAPEFATTLKPKTPTKRKRIDAPTIDHVGAMQIISEIALEHAKPGNYDSAFKTAGQALVYDHKMEREPAIQALASTLHLFPGKDRNSPQRLVNSLMSAQGYRG
ncbi:hypothetical protein QO002_001790 [Pararhizobium capsulatum DSM 1112]|uniref:Uncharacterized protein n=1 Tax=Pararhizobium capsulatum DSM 1112 TaxID=1121113 RepID=A0ABU0BNV7_9HYPH|nr:hypothetical protein [Pararhizobium capsulatum]MDQ0319652.1 hypothetical protein [Pararhizobium capsulatum DSM 1112]